MNDAPLEKELTELCNYYENESKIARQRIRKSLDERHAIKANIASGRERANTYLQILERLDEFEKLGRLQLEAAEKMEDPESLKKLEIIKKYESMVREQEEIWAKYEEEYEQLPTAKERRRVKLELLKTSIQIKLLYYKIDEKKKMIKLKKQISRRREQLAIIKFAQFMVEYKNREKQFCELQSKVNAFKKREQELREEIQQLEQLNTNRNNKINIIEKQTYMGSLSLPAMDLSCYIVSQKNDSSKDDAKTADTVSMYSLNLEQEYMNSEGDDAGKSLLKASAEQLEMDVSNPQNSASQETNAETLMDVNSEELSEMLQENIVIARGDKKDHSTIHNGANYSKESVNKSGRGAAKKRVGQNHVPENYSNNENIKVEQRNSRGLPERPIPMPPKIPKRVQIHESYSNCENTHDDQMDVGNMSGRKPCSPVVTAKVQQWQQTSSPRKVGPQMKTNGEPPRHYQQQRQQQQRQHQQQQQVEHHLNHQKFQRQQQQHQEQQQQQNHHPEQQRQQQQRKSMQQQQQQRKPVQQQQSLHQRQSQEQQHQRQSQQSQKQQQPQQQQQRQSQQPYQQQQQQHQRKPLQQQQQQQRPLSWSPSTQKDTDRQTFQGDFTGVLQSNKPLIISNERVNYDTQNIFQKHIIPQQVMKQQTDTSMEIEYDENETLDAAPQLNQQSHSASKENKSSILQSNQLMTPPYRSINADSMMSANMYSTDTNMSADNISAILGSEISEPGGIPGLIEHIHGDDSMSEDGTVPDYINEMNKFCSPIQPDNSKLHQQPIHNGNNQNSDQFSEAAANRDQQENTKRNFSILQFGQKNQSNPSQHLF